MKYPLRLAAALAVGALTCLPVAAQGRVFAVYDGGNFTIALFDVATGACAKVQQSGWKDAYFISYGHIPSCWARDKNRITVCPITNGKLVVSGCSVFGTNVFVARDSLPRPGFPN